MVLPASSRLKPRRARVLIAEDQQDVRNAAVEMLTRQGMIVRKASRPDQLLESIRRFKPDVIVLDDYFERSGLSFSKVMPSLLEHFPGLRVVVTMGKPSIGSAQAEDPLSWGAFAVVPKGDVLLHKSLDRSVAKAAGI